MRALPRIAVDDVGSGIFKGFACVATTDEGARELERRAGEILQGEAIDHFHGCRFRDLVHEPLYRAFVEAIGDVFKRHSGLAEFGLVPNAIFSELFEENAGEYFEQLVQALGHPGSDTIDHAKAKAGALLWLLRAIRPLGRCDVAVDLARDQVRDDDLNSAPVQLPSAWSMSATEILARAVNAFATQRRQFAPGPRLRPDQLRVVDARTNTLVQAADVIANFGLNFIKRFLRNGTPGSPIEAAKAEIFALLDREEPVPSWRAEFGVGKRNEITGSGNVVIRLELFTYT